ncbi:prepilin peptidase [Candidatus Saccharibacteria bacterium]|nr:prepilin peptidase [Candidatus Saccharibacteria bacterium]
MILTLMLLAGLGLCFGSFVNALVWRVRQQAISPPSLRLRWTGNKQKAINSKDLPITHFQFSILSGRSQCVNCHHLLVSKDLVPVLSWLFLRGRCRYCQKPISVQYPLVEIAGATVFVASYYFWPLHIAAGQWVLLVSWLATSVGLLALAVYDLRWMILPSRILYPTLALALGGRLAYILFFAQDKARSFWLLGLSVLVASGIFWVLFMISSGRWIGYGDIRLGLITGSVLASPAKSFLMIFLASVLGTLFVIPRLITKRQSFSSKLPYGPWLILSTALTLLFGEPIIDWYTQLLI